MFWILGLKHDDCLDQTPDVEEALRRLPKKLQDERTYRMIRAFQLSTMKTILPRDQWTKYEEVVNHFWLTSEDNEWLQVRLYIFRKG